jgi:hypothetical protein
MSKIEAFWENATADDVAGIANTRKSIAARARDEDTGHWRQVLLAGWKLARFGMGAIWIDADGVHWKHCQVYREPSWHANKPDPGPGFRLLEKFPDEDPQLGDSVFCPDSKRWLELEAGFDPGQLPTHWYRRRIEPVPKFAVGQTVKVIGPKATDAKHWDSEMARHVGTLQTIKYIEGFANPPEIFYGVYGIDSRKFREDYLEPVEPVEHYLGKVEAIKQFIVGDTFRHPNGLQLKVTEKGFEVTQ